MWEMQLARNNVLRRIRQKTSIASLVVASLVTVSLVVYPAAVVAAGPGSAPAASATTLPATHVTVTSADLNGLVETRGQATQWEFQYGVTTDHDRSTPLAQIPAGRGAVHVSASITGLSARTTYRFRLIAISGIGSHYVEVYYAADRTFTTSSWNGLVLLVGKHLHVVSQAVHVRLWCLSTRACAGGVAISVRAPGSPGKAVVCASKSFRVGANRRRRVMAAISQPCMTLLTSSPHHRLKGKFLSATTTGQRGQYIPVKLILG